MTPEQKEFLQAELLLYNAMTTKEYNHHFLAFFQEWARRWPERAITFLELPVDILLTTKQEKTLTDALSKHREVSNVTRFRLKC